VQLLLVAPSRSYRIGAFLAAAAELGAEVTVATDAPAAIPGSSLCVDFDDPSGAARQLVAAAASGDPFDGVVGTDGDAMAVAAETARLVGLPTNPGTALTAAGDKRLQRRAAAAVGLPQPEFAVIGGDELPAWSIYPAVLKPLDRSASQGVIAIDASDQLRAGVATVRSIVGPSAPVLLEAFVGGTEVAVECLLRYGRLEVLSIFDKPDTPNGPVFPETLLVSPGRLDEDVRARVVEVATAAVAAIGLIDGPVHVELKVDGDRVLFLELAARTIGGLCSRVVRHAGMSLEELVLRHALRLPVPVQPPAGTSGAAASGVLMLPVGQSGRLRAVGGVAEARSVDGIIDVVLSVAPGEEVVALPAGDRYLGFVFARGRSAAAVEAALRAAWGCLDVAVTAW